MTWKDWENYVPPQTTAPQRDPVRVSKRQKYGAVKTTVDGITFDSKKEAARYVELKLREHAGEIRDIALQVPFTLTAGPNITIGKYIADFVYRERFGQDWCVRVEDVKGFATPLFRWKAKHFNAQYGLEIIQS